jgi:RNA polymerase sigma-70 factor (ECF subfamily)
MQTLTNANTHAQTLASTKTAQDLAGGLVALRRELQAHALRLTRSQTQAEDLVQDTVERALRFEDRFERGTNLRAWAHQILVNVFISRCRRGRREGRALDALSSDPCAWTSHRTEALGYSELSRSTRRAIEELPLPFRSTIELIDVQELSYKAAADRLGVPIGTVMSRLHRGRRLLADALRDGIEHREAA